MMMRHWTAVLFTLWSVAVFAQPANDDCGGIIDLGIAPACPTTIFSNINATATDIGFGNNPTCFNGGGTQRDVWFSFVASDTIFDYTITVTGLTDGGSPAIVNPQLAIYRGSCETDGLAELLCISADPGENTVILNAMGLTPGVTYFLRINDYSASGNPNAGSFQLCVDEMDPISLIDQGGSTACSGQLFDSGGPDGDYSSTENHVFTICPAQPTACITFTLQYFNIEDGFGPNADQLIFYDAATADPAAIISSVGGTGVSAGGAVCYEVQASSGCLTLQFISDANVQFEGFAGSWLCSTQPCDAYQPISVSDDVTSADIIDALSTPQTQVSITSINCSDGSYGVFEAGDNTDLGLEKGLLLTTGDLNWAPGPNSSSGFGNTFADRFFPGDPDLDQLSLLFGEGTESQDACIIELDVLASTNELTFEYIFGSDEYPEFVGDEFNDIFAFLVSGPGITGLPELNNQLNIATLPTAANTVVQINSVNNFDNWEFYRNNELGQSMEYDGFTSDYLGVKKSLTARAAVIPCNTYHLKLAIADRGDGLFDSGVFISELRGGTPNISVRFNSGIDYLLEGCTELSDEVVIRLNNPVEDTLTYRVVIGGSATLGVDYLLDIPEEVTFLPGQTEYSFPISVLTDLDIENTELILIALTNDFGCGEVTYATVEVEIRDQLRININAGNEVAYFCAEGSLPLTVEGAAQYFWTPITVFDNPLSNAPIASPTESMWVRVEGQVGSSCVAVDSIFLQLIDPQITLEALDPVAICRGDSVRLQASDNVNGAGLLWTPSVSLNDPSSLTPVAMPLVDQLYIVSVNVTGCIATDSILIDVDFLNLPLLTADTTLCQNYPVTLSVLENANTTDTEYSWSPSAGLSGDEVPTPVALPDVTTTYQLIASSVNGACADTSSVTVNILAADVDISPQDTAFICLGEIASLTATTNTGSAQGLIWSPAMGLSDTASLQVTATPTESQWYRTTFVNGVCTVFDSVFVRVDSLPADLGFTLSPEKDVYCFGERVVFSSPIYDPANFPEMFHYWSSSLGALTPDSLYNLVVDLVDTINYQRITINNACRDTVNRVVRVIEPILPTIVPADTTICAGQSVQLSAQHSPNQQVTYEWTGSGLSCFNCPNPVATPTASASYQLRTEIDGECPESAQATITVNPLPFIDLVDNPVICLGDEISLLTSNPEAGTSYLWSSPQIPAFTSTDPLVSVMPVTTTSYVLNATNTCGTVTQNTTVTVIGDTELNITGDLIICPDQNTRLSLSTTPAVDPALLATAVWTWPGGSFTGASIEVGPDTNTTYTVTLSLGQCGSTTGSASVQVLDQPTVSISAQRDTVFSRAPIILIAETNPTTGITLNWTPAPDSQTGNTFNFTAPENADTTLLNQTYRVDLTTNEGCTAFATYTIAVKRPRGDVPNIFSPNGDSRNDVFKIFNAEEITDIDIRVYNRWGQLVYESDNNNGWDGNYKGDPAPADIYIYRVQFTIGGEIFDLTGELTLVR